MSRLSSPPPGPSAAGFARDAAQALRAHGVLSRGDRALVALSGGMDSVVLLHLLRFDPGFPELELIAAHFDHAMREGSGRDASWVRGLCRAWQVPLRSERAGEPPTSEEAAREARYSFLARIAAEEGASAILTAHHADDQAETVLFRVLRGTGLRGLAGITGRRWPGIYRPLLAFSRDEISDYAGKHGLGCRDDPTNRDLTIPRNLLRHRVIPMVEESVAPGARKALNRLAGIARDNETAWASILPSLLEGLVESDGEDLVVVRSGFLAYHPAVRNRLLRELFRRRGIRPGAAGTRAALEFTRTGVSGGGMDLPGGFRLVREFDRLVLCPKPDRERDRPLIIPGPSEGAGEVVVGGRCMAFQWGTRLPDGVEAVFRAPRCLLRFPLRLRGRAPGDRVRLPYGRKKLKRLFAEARIPASERDRIPVLADAEGRILWVLNLTSSLLDEEGDADDTDFLLGTCNARES